MGCICNMGGENLSRFLYFFSVLFLQSLLCMGSSLSEREKEKKKYYYCIVPPGGNLRPMICSNPTKEEDLRM